MAGRQPRGVPRVLRRFEQLAAHTGVRRRTRLSASVALCVLTTLVPDTAAPQGGAITGRATARDSGEPLSEARVVVIGTVFFTMTAADGRELLGGGAANNQAGPVTPQRLLRVSGASTKFDTDGRNLFFTVAADQSAVFVARIERR